MFNLLPFVFVLCHSFRNVFGSWFHSFVLYRVGFYFGGVVSRFVPLQNLFVCRPRLSCYSGGHSCWAAVERPCDCLFRPASTTIAGHYSLTEGIATVSTNTSTSVLWLCAEAHSLVDWGLQPVLAQMGAFGKRYQMSENDQMEVLEHRIHFDVKLFQLDVKMDWVEIQKPNPF